MTLRARLRGRVAAWARRRQGEDAPPLALRARRLYILPTRAGLGFSLLLFVMLIAGLNYTNSLGLLLTFTLTGYMLVGMYECQRTLQGLELLQASVQDCQAGTQGAIELRFANAHHTARRALSVRCADAPPTRFDLAAQATDTIKLAYHATRRGRLRLDRVSLATTAPIGLFRAWAWLHLPLTAIVYPRPEGLRPLPVGGASAQELQNTPAGDTEDQWATLRPFNAGDNPHRIAWKVYARGGPLMVAQYEGAGGEEVVLGFAGLEALDLEARLSQLAAWAIDCERRGAACALQLPGCELALGRGAAHYTALQRALALYGETPP